MGNDVSNQRRRCGSSSADAGPARSPWFGPLRSEESARLLAHLVAEQSLAVAGRAFKVDVAHGVVEAADGRWSASLGPLAARAAAVPHSGWPAIVDHEIRQWVRAAATVSEIGRRAASALQPRPMAVLRLTDPPETAGRTMRQAFRHLAWELVYDLGAEGPLAVGPAAAGVAAVELDEDWRQIAADTIRRYRHRWARLRPAGQPGLVLGGPYVSSLLFDPTDLRREIGAEGAALRVSVFGNDLLLVAAREGTPRPNLVAVSESLVRYAAVAARRFTPFSTVLT